MNLLLRFLGWLPGFALDRDIGRRYLGTVLPNDILAELRTEQWSLRTFWGRRYIRVVPLKTHYWRVLRPSEPLTGAAALPVFTDDITSNRTTWARRLTADDLVRELARFRRTPSVNGAVRKHIIANSDHYST